MRSGDPRGARGGSRGRERASRAFPKFESYGMPVTAAFRGWKAQDAIEWFHGIGRLVEVQQRPVRELFCSESEQTIQHLIRCSLGVAVVTTGGCCSCDFRPQISLPNGTAVADYHREDGPSCPLGALFYSRQLQLGGGARRNTLRLLAGIEEWNNGNQTCRLPAIE